MSEPAKEMLPLSEERGRASRRRRQRILGAVGLVCAGIGVSVGAGVYTFVYAQGFSYLRDDPQACINCHVMQEQFDGWEKSSHHAVATCNDCHTPHNFIGKYLTKASNGYHHSRAFTLGDFHEPIQITASNRAITESTCRHCHQDIVQAIDTHFVSGQEAEAMSCIRCHISAGHLH